MGLDEIFTRLLVGIVLYLIVGVMVGVKTLHDKDLTDQVMGAGMISCIKSWPLVLATQAGLFTVKKVRGVGSE